MYYYNIYGLNIASDYEFEEAIAIDKTEDLDVDIIHSVDGDKEFEIPETGNVSKGYFYCHDKSYSWVRYPRFGEFVILNGKTIKYRLFDGYDRLYVNEIFLCLVIPILIVQRNQIMLHGSGLSFNGKCLVISGESGAGKSTVTNAFINQGAKYLADDTVTLTIEDVVYANSAYPQQKLCLDQISEDMKQDSELVLLPEDDGERKYGVRNINNFSFGKHKLDAFIVLHPTDKIEEPIIEEIGGAEKLVILMDNLYSYDAYRDMGMPPELFKQCLAASSAIKIYKLSRPLKGMTTSRQLELIRSKL